MPALNDTDSAGSGLQSGAWGQPKEFLCALFDTSDTIALRPLESWSEGGRKRTRVDHKGVRYAPLVSLLASWDTILERAANNKTNLFFGVCPRFGGNKSKSYDFAWQIRTVRCLWLDIDDTGPEGATERCLAAGLPKPSIVVSSGRGAHLYWLLDSPYQIDDVSDPPPIKKDWVEINGKRKPIKYFEEAGGRVYLDDAETGKPIAANRPALSEKAQHVQDIIAGMAAKTDGDHTVDLSRLLRLPGTLNRKDERNGREPVPCDLVHIDADCRYRISDFDKFATESPSKKKRELVAKVKLPAPRKLTATKEDRFNELLTICGIAEDRSQADFALCCFAVEQGMQAPDVWSHVASVGKFAERGREYFERTWAKAEGHTRAKIYEKAERKANGKPREATSPTAQGSGGLRNFATVEADDGTEDIPLQMADILEMLRRKYGGWPRRACDSLFVHDGDSVDWLSSTASFLGWLQSKDYVTWHNRGSGFVTKDEFFAEVLRTAEACESVETQPHFPPLENHYYTWTPPEPGDGARLQEFLDFFTPSTTIDGDLIKAFVATTVWGGPGGTRPMFAFTSEKGRGKGKTATVEKIAMLTGGCYSFNRGDDPERIKSRLLSFTRLTKRICLLDNVKTEWFSWDSLESMISSRTISGHRLYRGEGERPNHLIWAITINGPAFSRDVAQRTVSIRLSDLTYSGNWVRDVDAFIANHRQDVMADLAAFFQEKPSSLSNYSRWGTWDAEVVARLPEPADAQKVILERQGLLDADQEEADDLEDFFCHKLGALGYDTDCDNVHIPNTVSAVWYGEFCGRRVTPTKTTQKIRQLVAEGMITRIQISRRRVARGHLWCPTPVVDVVKYDLEERLRRAEVGWR